MKFLSGGEKRKFFQNQRHFGRTQNIAVASFGLLTALAPIVAVLIVACVAVAVWKAPHHHQAFLGPHLTTLSPLFGMVGLPFAKRGFLTGDAAERMKKLHQGMFGKELASFGVKLEDDGPRKPRPNTTVPGNLDRQSGYLWDTLTVAANTAFPNQTTMFSVPLSGNTKQLAGTNLTQSGQLPFPQMIDVNALRIYVLNNATPTDILALFTNVSIQVLVNNFSKFEGLPWMLPAGGGLWVVASQVGTAPAGSAVVFSANNGEPTLKNVYTLGDIIHIGAGEPFSVVVTANNPFNTQANSTNPPGTGFTIVFAMEGDRYRPLGG